MESRCIICNTVLPEGGEICPLCALDTSTYDHQIKEMAENFPDYPCHRCRHKHKESCKCDGWKHWVAIHWKKFQANKRE